LPGWSSGPVRSRRCGRWPGFCPGTARDARKPVRAPAGPSFARALDHVAYVRMRNCSTALNAVRGRPGRVSRSRVGEQPVRPARLRARWAGIRRPSPAGLAADTNPPDLGGRRPWSRRAARLLESGPGVVGRAFVASTAGLKPPNRESGFDGSARGKLGRPWPPGRRGRQEPVRTDSVGRPQADMLGPIPRSATRPRERAESQPGPTFAHTPGANGARKRSCRWPSWIIKRWFMVGSSFVRVGGAKDWRSGDGLRLEPERSVEGRAGVGRANGRRV